MEISVTPYNDQAMQPIIEEFKKMESSIGRHKTEVLVYQNLIFVLNLSQRFVEFYSLGQNLSYYDPDDYKVESIRACCYYKVNATQIDITEDKLREQFLINLIKDKYQVGLFPYPTKSGIEISQSSGADFRFSLISKTTETDCILEINKFSEDFWPEFGWFTNFLDIFCDFISTSISFPNANVDRNDIVEYFENSISRGFFKQLPEWWERENNEFNIEDPEVTEYRRRSIEEQGYDDYDYLNEEEEEESYNDSSDEQEEDQEFQASNDTEEEIRGKIEGEKIDPYKQVVVNFLDFIYQKT